MSRPAEHLRHILDAIDRLSKVVDRGRDAFDRDVLIQHGVLHNLMIIGEAAKRLPVETINRRPDVPWRRIVALRNVIVLEYDDVDAVETWNIPVRDLTPPKTAVEGLLRELEWPGTPS